LAGIASIHARNLPAYSTPERTEKTRIPAIRRAGYYGHMTDLPPASVPVQGFVAGNFEQDKEKGSGFLPVPFSIFMLEICFKA
jgi:hypothetical protein